MTNIIKFQYRKRYGPVATLFCGYFNSLFDRAFQYRKRYGPVATVKLEINECKENRFNTASGMYALQQLYVACKGSSWAFSFQYRKRYVRVATNMFLTIQANVTGFNTASGITQLQLKSIRLKIKIRACFNTASGITQLQLLMLGIKHLQR